MRSVTREESLSSVLARLDDVLSISGGNREVW
jgi:hypothetical protein